ncbi:hypothetical protein [Treponema sp.]|uniref:hypothetical protein n=1 Tax=Treponema sp. TaxID=166 RepID=UPI00257B091E|nr:hypothetical protein [Treponema sp.]MBE6354244.1 hypothetical protein [Treponema sp.]
MKKLFIVLVFSIFSFSANALSVKDYVCKIEPSDSNQEYKVLNTLYLQLSRESSYSSLKYHISELKEKLSSYGFTVKLSDSNYYVITSCTSMDECSKVKITFYDSQNKNTVIDDLSITYTDRDLGLALIKLPAGFNGNSCELHTRQLEEDTDIYTVSINGKTIESYRAYITNNSNETDEIITYAISRRYYNHEKGMPVLIKIGNEYKVCAASILTKFELINKGDYDRDTSTVLPAKYIQNFADAYIQQSKNISVPDIKETAEIFSDQISLYKNDKTKNAEQLIPFISRELFIKYGNGMVKKYYGQMKDEENTFILEKFKKNPFDGVRAIFALYMLNELKTESKNAFTEFTIEEEKDFYRILFKNCKGNSISTEWKIEDGRYKITFFENLASEKLPEKFTRGFFNYDNFAFDYLDENSGLTFEGGIFNLMEDEGINRNINSGYGSLGADLIFFGAGTYYQNEIARLTINNEEKNVRMHSVGGYARIQIPVMISLIKTEVIPFMEGKIGLANAHELFYGNTARIHTGASIGINLVFMTDTLLQPFLNASFNSNSYNGKDTVSSFSAGAGIKIRFSLNM